MPDGPATRGDVVRLFSVDGAERELTVTAPSGLKVIFPASRSVKLWVPQTGTWTYDWGAGDVGTVEVVDEHRPTVATNPADLPPMVATTRPRR